MRFNRNRLMFIALTGFMGCGKSSVARELAELWGCFYFDLDLTIEQEEGRSIAEIFESEGESGFRILEYEYLSRIFSDFEDFPSDRIVIALGGGTPVTQQCSRLLKENATSIYLRESVEELVSNLLETGTDSRPMLCGKDRTADTYAGSAGDTGNAEKKVQSLRDKVSALLGVRREIYENTADFIIDADGMSPGEIARRIDVMLSGKL